MLLISLVQAQSYNDTMFWGTYRPNLYFGTRTRTAHTLLTGLMWYGTTDINQQPWDNIRHTCEHDDNISGYAWHKHDGQTFGTQAVRDNLYNIIITTDFVKVPGDHPGGDWAVRITGTCIDADLPCDVTLGFYGALDGPGVVGFTSPDTLSGSTPELGDFKIKVRENEKNEYPEHVAPGHYQLPDTSKMNTLAFSLPGEQAWKIKDYYRAFSVQTAEKLMQQYKDPLPPVANLFYLQDSQERKGSIGLFQRAFSGDFEIEFAYISESQPHSKDYGDHLFGDALTKLLQERESAFDQKFESIFQLDAKHYPKGQQEFGKMLLSNMLGGMGFFHGTAIVDRALEGLETTEPIDFLDQVVDNEVDNDYFSDDDDFGSSTEKRTPNPQFEGPFSLFTGVPSRPFFPRGFLWDSGFDDHLISEWNADISRDILSHWAMLIDEEGWVAREQILGDEARSKVPEEFQTQYPHFGNPPTLITAFQRALDRFSSSQLGMEQTDVQQEHQQSRDQAAQFLKRVYPKFKQQYGWFKRTQWGEVDQHTTDQTLFGFRWRGKKGTHVLTSGLDDYPRAHISDTAELHLDLISWMAYYAKALGTCAKQLGFEEDAKFFEKDHKKLVQSLEALHWDPSSSSFTDVSFHGGSKSNAVHHGYITLFPMLLGLLPPDSPKLGALLDLIYDPQQLWSPYGICSLSKSDVFFGQGENYWRGPIWININYLVLQSLHNNYIAVPGPYQQKAQTIFKELRQNVISNLYAEYVRTGYVWEQYSCLDGRGARSHPFTGWTSLGLLIMTDKY
ncbi:glycoside hydrolase [Gorgonomyces haynaldii]|nr:glycoside hydrolase [Gorgonomyces haynaldii]